jgi:hypothetical protein
MELKIFSILFVLFINIKPTIAQVSDCSIGAIKDQLDNFLKVNNSNKYIKNSGSNVFYIVNPNVSDTNLYDIIFNKINWTCLNEITVQLFFANTEKKVYSRTHSKEQLENLYLSNYPNHPENLIIRLDFEKNRELVINDENEGFFYRLKLIHNGKTIYGESPKDIKLKFGTPSE